MNQGLERSAQEREQDLLEEERAKDEPLPDLIINGQTYQVRKNRDDLGRGLYVALRNRNWAAAARFLEAYRALANPDPLLVHYAQGKLARLRGELETAEAEFRALLALKPAFCRGVWNWRGCCSRITRTGKRDDGSAIFGTACLRGSSR
ncbi:hypothetical protein HML84_08800 [Alcanivorax sp. IO_7]|nr:hypothetical protein HML84_08800 [Alcanivorax sp. IO_7]